MSELDQVYEQVDEQSLIENGSQRYDWRSELHILGSLALVASIGMPSFHQSVEISPPLVPGHEIVVGPSTNPSHLRPAESGIVNDNDGFNVYYYYAEGNYSDSARGMTATITQADPTIGNGDLHSLAEIAEVSANQKQTVEFGWDVDPSLYNDNLPHLFVYHFLNGQPTCYNACGFVPIDNPKGIVPGETLAAGVSARYQILYSGASKEWLISYNGNEIGYFPESIWGGKFTKSSDETAFGEVASMSSSEPCSQMGDGVFGSNTGSTTISKFDLIDPRPIATGAQMLFSSTVSSLYNVGHETADGFRFGGPGEASSGNCAS
ncbi:MAG TPA: neprosin family prolyl endopeptidase [Candidatus Saccharimonadales bacterium]|jgi:hypothetical protein|nr:neprosin family prolyl endopeptidase [Candidatus Saccharimonadales bacterium]